MLNLRKLVPALMVQSRHDNKKFFNPEKYKQAMTIMSRSINYFEKDNATSTKVTDKMKRTNIIKDFVLSTEGIGGFDKEKLKEVYSYINEQ